MVKTHPVKVGVLLAPAVCAAPLSAQIFEPLPVLAGASSCYARGISPDGSAVVGGCIVSGAESAVLWLGGQPLVVGPGTATACSLSGEVVVGLAPGSIAFRWTATGGAATIRNEAAEVTDCSSDGNTVTGIFGSAPPVGPGYHGFIWRAPDQLCSTPGGSGVEHPYSSASAVSDDGLVIYGGRNGTNGGIIRITQGCAAATVSAALVSVRATNATGSAIAGSTSQTGFRGTAENWTRWLGNWFPYGISADGQRIVGKTAAEAMIWEPSTGPRPLKNVLISLGNTIVQDWSLLDASEISADGRSVTGTAWSASTGNVAFRASLPAFCYGNCDGSTSTPTLNMADFACFLSRFAAGDVLYANCDQSTTAPALNVADFTCFIRSFAAGCP